MDTIVAIFAHPDDESCGIGGTLWLLKDRYQILLLCLTRGERGLSPGFIEVRAETARIREAEMRSVTRLLGAEVRFLDRIDGEVFADRAICELVACILREVRPVLIFGMWPIDAHPDHAAASDIARKAMRIAGYNGEFWMHEEGIGQTAQFEPDLCVDISAVAEAKNQLIRCHACQNTDDALVHAMEELNRIRGSKAGCGLAEAFKSAQTRLAGKPSILATLNAR